MPITLLTGLRWAVKTGFYLTVLNHEDYDEILTVLEKRWKMC